MSLAGHQASPEMGETEAQESTAQSFVGMFTEFTPEDTFGRNKTILQQNSNHVLVQDEQKLSNHLDMQRLSNVTWYINVILDSEREIRLIALQALPQHPKDTPGKIALIDMRLMQQRAFSVTGRRSELSLRTLLESPDHIKVVFDNHIVAGHLMRRYGIKMVNFSSIQLTSNAIAVAACDGDTPKVPDLEHLGDSACSHVEHMTDLEHEFRCVLAHTYDMCAIAAMPGAVKLELASYAISSIFVMRKLNEINCLVATEDILDASIKLCIRYTEDLTTPRCTECDRLLPTPSPFTQDLFGRIQLLPLPFDTDNGEGGGDEEVSGEEDEASNGADGTDDGTEQSSDSSDTEPDSSSDSHGNTPTTTANSPITDAAKTFRRRRRRGRHNKKDDSQRPLPPLVEYDFLCPNGTGYMSAYDQPSDPVDNAFPDVLPDTNADAHSHAQPVKSPKDSSLRYDPAMDFTPLRPQPAAKAGKSPAPKPVPVESDASGPSSIIKKEEEEEDRAPSSAK